MKETINIAQLVKALPETPGVYKYMDKNENVIYVGKAKNLKKRVSSYFGKKRVSYKTNLLVKRIHNIEYIVVDTEGDALLLENILIKKLKPKYNVLLKDDKTYPWLIIKNENFPRVFHTRQKIDDGSEYYGPFPSVYTIKTLLSLVKQLYPIRTCSLNLSNDNIKAGKYAVCLEYHIGNCKAPCIGKIDEDTYNSYIEDIRNIVKGNLNSVLQYLKEKMHKYAEEYNYEKAAEVKEKIEIVENYKSKSTIVNTGISNLEVFGFAKDINSVYINYLKVHNGTVVGAQSTEIRKRMDESDQDVLSFAIVEFRNMFNSNTKDIIVPFMPEYKLDNLNFLVPKRGDKRKLLDLANRNAKFFMLDKHKQIENKNPEKHTIRKLETLKKDLHLKDLPIHIECFDNSNIQGTNPVAACVVFRNTKPAKKEYRHYNVKTVVGPDDYASMREIVCRRYKRLLEENKSLPQLIIVDGGKGQLSAAVQSLKKLGLYGKMAVIGIAEKLEEIYFPEDSTPLYLDKNSESLKIIQQARDEAHRFGLSFHRDKRSQKFIKSELNNISGIGPKTIEDLLKNFKSVSRIKKANLQDLEQVVGKAKAKIIHEYFTSASSGF
ncbi:MAG: excinuclease ABC subunit UvrC [Bacteroidales bacterium]|nr:excinuclease ABC subunit UvrC [Bacteroidales bacterium]